MKSKNNNNQETSSLQDILEKPLITPNQASELLQVSPRTVYQWVEEGKIPSLKIAGTVRIKTKELLSSQL